MVTRSGGECARKFFGDVMKFTRLLIMAFIGFLWLAPGSASAQELVHPATPAEEKKPQEKVPPPLTHYMGREIAQTMHFAGAPWLTRESRDREEEPAKLMKALKINPG